MGPPHGGRAARTVTAPIALVPNAHKTKENEPGYRAISRKNGFELGASANRVSRNTGEEYISVSQLERPGSRDDLRQRRTGARRRSREEGLHLEPGQLAPSSPAREVIVSRFQLLGWELPTPYTAAGR
jgi:uncharacterized protein (DUF736 family)